MATSATHIMQGQQFFTNLDHIYVDSSLVVDRAKDTKHPRVSQAVYPVDYGYLEAEASLPTRKYPHEYRPDQRSERLRKVLNENRLVAAFGDSHIFPRPLGSNCIPVLDLVREPRERSMASDYTGRKIDTEHYLGGSAHQAFESHGVPVYAMAEVSITRFTNNGPLSLFSLLLFTSTFGIRLGILAIGLLLSVFPSQFTSTMLVSDLAESHIASFDQQTNYGYNYEKENRNIDSESLSVHGVDYWNQRPSASEIFAEYSQPVDAPDGVDDTGPTIRAFLPVPTQADRETLRSFNGKTRIFDARVVCITSPDGLGKIYMYLQMTLCFDALDRESPNGVSDILNITAYGPSNHTEPFFTFNHEQNIYDTLTVRRQLGAVTPAETKDGPERQILTISPEDMEASLNETDKKHLQNLNDTNYLN
ncbi:hypothetical protein NM208_g4752 [Fusarium decemcellulare]|uniref:Uncharacterized protein n=1 Tax=Fusarium decemcellulare TaxID=57161 RepID=A0ACC1SJM4_9HYPO|nr:hypothetical protein NM208_g4752 [Fusarium decemcellulare]